MMLRLVLASLLMVTTLSPFFGTAAAADTYVRGYTRNDGTYVQPHYRSAPDGNPYNNWSTKGNENPYTGKPGTRSPDSFSNPPNPNPYGYYGRPTPPYDPGNPYQEQRQR